MVEKGKDKLGRREVLFNMSTCIIYFEQNVC